MKRSSVIRAILDTIHLSNCEDLLTVCNDNRRTPLHMAVLGKNGSGACLELLVSKLIGEHQKKKTVGGELDQRKQGTEDNPLNAADSNGRTALMYCAERGDTDAARLLIQRGADALVVNHTATDEKLFTLPHYEAALQSFNCWSTQSGRRKTPSCLICIHRLEIQLFVWPSTRVKPTASENCIALTIR